MNEGSGKANPIETALLELEEARRAGVFERTRVDARALRAGPASVAWWRWQRAGVRGLSIAAVLALAVGVWGWMFAKEIGSLRPAEPLVGSVADFSSPICNGKFQDCLTGPLAQAGSPRGINDHDGDGDVDLRDIRELQNSFRPVSR